MYAEIHILLNSVFELNVVSSNKQLGWTALLHASMEGHFMVAKYLVEEPKAAVHIKDQVRTMFYSSLTSQ